MKTVTSTPVDFDTWMRRHGPKNDTPAPKPTERQPQVQVQGPPIRGNYKGKPIPAPLNVGADQWFDDQFGSDRYIQFPCDAVDWYIMVYMDSNQPGSYTYGYMTPDAYIIDEHGGSKYKVQPATRQEIEAWLQQQGVPQPPADKWNWVNL